MNCDIFIAIWHIKLDAGDCRKRRVMTLGEKIRYLREVEGSLRGLGRPMTQQELMKAIRKETGKAISQSYLSQIESGRRPHMTQSTRTLLARFFKVHPGFLVDDPEGYHAELTSDLRTTEGQLDVWLLQGSERFASDPASKRGAHQGGPRNGHAPRASTARRNFEYARPGRPIVPGAKPGRQRAAPQVDRGGGRRARAGIECEAMRTAVSSPLKFDEAKEAKPK